MWDRLASLVNFISAALVLLASKEFIHSTWAPWVIGATCVAVVSFNGHSWWTRNAPIRALRREERQRTKAIAAGRVAAAPHVSTLCSLVTTYLRPSLDSGLGRHLDDLTSHLELDSPDRQIGLRARIAFSYLTMWTSAVPTNGVGDADPATLAVFLDRAAYEVLAHTRQLAREVNMDVPPERAERLCRSANAFMDKWNAIARKIREQAPYFPRLRLYDPEQDYFSPIEIRFRR